MKVLTNNLYVMVFADSYQSNCRQSNFHIREKSYHYISALLEESILGQGKCQLLITTVAPLVQWE